MGKKKDKSLQKTLRGFSDEKADSFRVTDELVFTIPNIGTYAISTNIVVAKGVAYRECEKVLKKANLPSSEEYVNRLDDLTSFADIINDTVMDVLQDNIELFVKRVKNTNLARRMYPDAIEIDGYLHIYIKGED